jgi:hypothetical protein
MSTFQWVTARGGGTAYGHELTMNGAAGKPGLLVIQDTGSNTVGSTVSLAGSTGSQPFGFLYGMRDLLYAPVTETYATGEAVTVLTGHGFAEFSADFFSTGSLPTELAGGHVIYAGASGTLALTGTLAIGRLIDINSYTAPSAGTGTSTSVALIEFDFKAGN